MRLGSRQQLFQELPGLALAPFQLRPPTASSASRWMLLSACASPRASDWRCQSPVRRVADNGAAGDPDVRGMIALPAGARILLATKRVDFRKGGHSLAALAAEVPGANPFPGTVLVFRSRRDDWGQDSRLGRQCRRAGRGRLPAHLPRIGAGGIGLPLLPVPPFEIGIDAVERAAAAPRRQEYHRPPDREP